MKQWARIPDHVKSAIKQALLQILCQEPTSIVKHTTAGVIRFGLA